MGRKKRFRGKRTHGRGKKAGRGAGLRGGRGNAGLHKHKYMSLVKFDPDHFGVHGFKRHPSLKHEKKVINISEMEQRIEEFMEKGFAKKEKEIITVDLASMGFEKLLGKGSATMKMNVLIPEATSTAESKIVEAGGAVQRGLETEEE